MLVPSRLFQPSISLGSPRAQKSILMILFLMEISQSFTLLVSDRQYLVSDRIRSERIYLKFCRCQTFNAQALNLVYRGKSAPSDYPMVSLRLNWDPLVSTEGCNRHIQDPYLLSVLARSRTFSGRVFDHALPHLDPLSTKAH